MSSRSPCFKSVKLRTHLTLPTCWSHKNQRALYTFIQTGLVVCALYWYYSRTSFPPPKWPILCRVGRYTLLTQLSDFVAFLCPYHEFGTSCHMTYASETHYLYLNLISRHFTSAITRTSNTGPLVSPLSTTNMRALSKYCILMRQSSFSARDTCC